MNTNIRKIIAVVEVTLVTFLLVPYLAVGIYRLFPGFESWQIDTLGFPVPPLFTYWR
jgi:predicted Na+-dependent transporter